MKIGAKYLLGIVLGLLVIAIPCTAQIINGAGQTIATEFHGIHKINGRVVWPDGTPYNGKIRIRLASVLGGDVIDSTDDEGKFVFTGLKDGTYTVTIDEDAEHGSASSMVDVTGGSFPVSQTYYVTLRMSEKRNGQGRPAVISSSSADVPKGAMTFYNKAIELSKAGDHKGAIDQLNLAVAQDPTFMTALTEIGVQYMILGDLEKADTALLAALKVKADAYEPLMNRGIILVRLKKFAEAEPVIQNAIKANASGLAYYWLGRALVGLGKQDDATVALKTAIKAGGDDIREAHRALAMIYMDKMDDKNAIDELETYLKLNPTAPDADKLKQVVAQLKSPQQSPTKPQ